MEAPSALPISSPPAPDWASLVDLQTRLNTILDFEALVQEALRESAAFSGAARAVILFTDDVAATEDSVIRPVGVTGYVPATLRSLRETIAFSTHDADPAIAAWSRREVYHDAAHEALRSLVTAVEMQAWVGLPIVVRGMLMGALILDLPELPAAPVVAWLKSLANSIGVALRNARLHSQATSSLNARMNELAILQRIDLELSEQIHASHVFDMTLDWVLRYTGSNAGTIAVYDEDSDVLKFVAEIGYEAPEATRTMVRNAADGGIAKRVAHSARSELIPDVSNDPDFAPVSTVMRSHLSVPVMKEDRVIAVISVESRKLNHFNDDHLTFVERLAARAGNAMDNARLFSQTSSEREKLANILLNITDVVVVFNAEDRLVLMNQSAYPVLRLYTDGKYEGQSAEAVLEGTDLLPVYTEARKLQDTISQELQMPNGRTYSAHLSFHSHVGCIIVLQDITEAKETDQLKNELIATVSHDLKQPLTVMQGYLELLLMSTQMEGRPLEYVRAAQRSIANMRGLIDDLLSLAKIESGIQLNMRALDLKTILDRCISDLGASAEMKSISIKLDVPDGLMVQGDHLSLGQIFNNLIGNAVKYTPPEGKVTVNCERRGDVVVVTVADTGLGISPEDQAKIFNRFYRVRRPETEMIDGTGLGLAIVKRLVELHRGHIGVDSRLGEGSRFIVTLSAGKDPEI
ncbi:MAG: GAF domain-containing protein [Pleurocapsa minor GSE-CHR-MK-17-07R]|jgi:signal transduction histidine kinase|nr:GAF domain-containing protein [Pleurocapsa minor GSE-CHR-MK 17-07R]